MLKRYLKSQEALIARYVQMDTDSLMQELAREVRPTQGDLQYQMFSAFMRFLLPKLAHYFPSTNMERALEHLAWVQSAICRTLRSEQIALYNMTEQDAMKRVCVIILETDRFFMTVASPALTAAIIVRGMPTVISRCK
jgi:AcrR family transcriptional regulator